MSSVSLLVQQWLQACQKKKIVVALSGGVDSVVLLHGLVKAVQDLPDYTIRAIHINHRLSDNAEDWVMTCQRICEGWSVDLSVYTMDVAIPSGDSIESAARQFRYQVLKDHVAADEVVVTAHHQQDQAETFLLQLIRGAGVKGLSAMPRQKKLKEQGLFRPLLTSSQSDILSYANSHHLEWVEDDSNQDIRFDRNYLRHKVLPILGQRWSHIAEMIGRSARHCAEASLLLADLAEMDRVTCQLADDQLSLSQLALLSLERQKNVIRHWLLDSGCLLPSEKQLKIIYEEVINAQVDAMPCFQWRQWQCRRYQDILYVMPILPSFDVTDVINWDMEQDATLADGRVISVNHPQVQQCKQQFPGRMVTVRFRQGGELFYPSKTAGAQSLKHLFQQWRVPPWLRERVPLFYVGQRCVVVLNYAVVDV